MPPEFPEQARQPLGPDPHLERVYLHVDPLDEQWTSTDATAEASALDALMQTMLAQRADARAAKDWAAADRIRDAIAAAGITLEDSADGTHWSIDG